MSADEIAREHARLLAEQAALREEHMRLEANPGDVPGHIEHSRRLRAHIEALHAHIAALNAR
jgi:hypothetical protein